MTFLEQKPLTEDTYCLTYYYKEVNKFFTVLVSYLVPYLWSYTNKKLELESGIGDTRLILQCPLEMPALYLIPFDDPNAIRLGGDIKIVNIIKEDGQILTINIPMTFPYEILEYMHYKIEKNMLFKLDNKQWKQIQI